MIDVYPVVEHDRCATYFGALIGICLVSPIRIQVLSA